MEPPEHGSKIVRDHTVYRFVGMDGGEAVMTTRYAGLEREEA